MNTKPLSTELLQKMDAYWRAAKLKKVLEDKLVEHRKYIDKDGLDLPEIRNWKWDPNGTSIEKTFSAVEK